MFPPELEHTKVTVDPALMRQLRGRRSALDTKRAPHRPKLSWALLVVVGLPALLLGLEVLTPFLNDGLSIDTIKEGLWRLGLILSFLALGLFYDATPVDHLGPIRRAFTNLLLCIGGMALFAAIILVRLDNHTATLAAVFVCFLSLLWARSNAV